MRRFIFRAVVLCIGIILLASACGYCLFAENADADHLSSMLRMQREKDEHLRRRYEAMKKAIGEVAAKRRVYQEITQREKQLKSDETGAILFSKQKKPQGTPSSFKITPRPKQPFYKARVLGQSPQQTQKSEGGYRFKVFIIIGLIIISVAGVRIYKRYGKQ